MSNGRKPPPPPPHSSSGQGPCAVWALGILASGLTVIVGIGMAIKEILGV